MKKGILISITCLLAIFGIQYLRYYGERMGNKGILWNSFEHDKHNHPPKET